MKQGHEAMKEPVVTSKGTRSRRTIATLTWLGLTIVAAALWYGRVFGTIRGAATEPVALLLSAYASFSSIFAWMLFAPNRRSAEESPVIFLAGGITLLAPCVISFCIMPLDSPLRGWLTVGVFMLTVIAVMSPVPEEFFAVPRDRSTYLRLISDSSFSGLPVADHTPGFDGLNVPAVHHRSVGLPFADRLEPSEWRGEARDPWLDPFRGTGIHPVRPGSRVRERGTSARKSSSRDSASEQTPASQRASDAQPATSLPREPENRSLKTSGRVGAAANAPAVRSPVPARPAATFGFRTPTTERSADHRRSADITEDFGHSVDSDGAVDSSFSTEPAVHDAVHHQVQFERHRDALGTETIQGTARVVFEVGQKRANLHIAFSPPLNGIPEVECEAVDEVPLRLKVPVRQTYGIRIEARRSEADERLETEVGFAAVCRDAV